MTLGDWILALAVGACFAALIVVKVWQDEGAYPSPPVEVKAVRFDATPGKDWVSWWSADDAQVERAFDVHDTFGDMDPAIDMLAVPHEDTIIRWGRMEAESCLYVAKWGTAWQVPRFCRPDTSWLR